MALERTLSIVKPDGVKKNVIGKILALFEENHLHVAAAKMVQLNRHEAEGFYAEHKARGFFGELVDFMTSGPVVLLVLEGEGAILKNREIMGATDPAKAAEGTIRKMFASSIGENTVHGSDSAASAEREVAWFFSQNEIFTH
jgi:nucleoside-diphosphate kinase